MRHYVDMNDEQMVAVRDSLRRNPGLTESGLRSGMRSTFGSSEAVDRALASGHAYRDGHKLYWNEQAED